jgi:uracil-DNA glycosylase
MITLLDELALCGDWANALAPEKARLARIDDYLLKKEQENEVYPPRGQRLAALRATRLSEVKMVITAQDPYPGKEHGIPLAMGLALSVSPSVTIPKSLKNMYAELAQSQGMSSPTHGDLSSWAKQGVLLLNVLLSLDAGQPKSHRDSEWASFTQAVLALVNQQVTPVVFLALGRDSQKLSQPFENTHHHVIKTSHPSPLGYKKTSKHGHFVAFYGSGCFQQVNHKLKAVGRTPIRWESVLE